MISVNRQFYEFFIELLFPRKCVICGKYGAVCCFDCLRLIEKIHTDTCPECGRISENSRYCPMCRRKRPNLYSISVSCNYHSESVHGLIAQFKYQGMTSVVPIIGELMYERISHQQKRLENTVVIPVPLHRRRQNYRGFNQSELLARYLSERLGMPGGDALIRIRNTKNQVGLKREQRLNNLEGAFVCRDIDFIAGKNILLIDDVMTTGATLNECAKTLKQAGAKKVYGLVAARNI